MEAHGLAAPAAPLELSEEHNASGKDHPVGDDQSCMISLIDDSKMVDMVHLHTLQVHYGSLVRVPVAMIGLVVAMARVMAGV